MNWCEPALERVSSSQTLANGVYLYVVAVKGYDGKVINSEVRKLVIPALAL